MSSEKMDEIEDLKLLLSHSRHQIVILKTELLHTIQTSEREQRELKHLYSSKISELEFEFRKLEEEKSLELEKSLQVQKCLEQQKFAMLEDELNAVQRDRDKEREKTFETSEQLKLAFKEKDESLRMLKASNDQLKEKTASLEAQLDQSSTHRHELEITLNSERHQTKMMKNKFEMEKKALEESVEKHLRSQREMEKKISDLNEHHLIESQQLLQENDQLLNRIQILENTLKGIGVSQEEPLYQATDLQEKIHELNVSTKDKLLLESKSKECEELKDELVKEKEISIQLQEEVGDVISELKKLQKENSDLHTVNKSLDKR
ncbi:hypothetical protein Anas_01576 [Armadillidium nasatum]|uniref:Uncharacterized protein n=1 Tax=Armadillidium nasatum TaxID=96803 RepID=A0A5N5T9G5_9CRUS|nr:hypothetical protein Anas_01576 [Armadillidium nasatum]